MRIEKVKIFEKDLSERNERYKQELREKITLAEKEAIFELYRIKIKFKFQKGFYKVTGKNKGLHYIVDFYIPSLRLAVEIDGGYHDTYEQIKRDRFRDDWLLRKRKIRVLRISNENAGNILNLIDDFTETIPKKGIDKKYWNEKYQGLIVTEH